MRVLFKFAVLLLPVVLALSTSSASAATGCAGAPAASAINQYCETFPSSSGSHSSSSGASSLASKLPPRVVHRLSAGSSGTVVTATTTSGATTTVTATTTTGGATQSTKADAGGSDKSPTAQQRLLTLPAAPVHRVHGTLRAASTSAVSLYSTLLIGLIVIAVALAATTLVLARHRRASGS